VKSIETVSLASKSFILKAKAVQTHRADQRPALIVLVVLTLDVDSSSVPG
jgi:hypothetical protein